MTPIRNTFYNNKAPVDNDLSLAARRYQQASHPPIIGKRFRSEYHGCQSYSIKFYIARGLLILYGPIHGYQMRRVDRSMEVT